MKREFKNLLKASTLTVPVLMLQTKAHAANYIAESTIGMGITNMLKDAAPWAMGIGASVSLISAIIILIRKMMAQTSGENAGRSYNKELMTCVFAGVAVFLVGGIMTVIGHYFGVDVNAGI